MTGVWKFIQFVDILDNACFSPNFIYFAWWWGWAPMVNQLSRIKSSHDMLERVYNIEKKLKIGLGGGK